VPYRGGLHGRKGDGMTEASGRDKWIEAGLKEIGRGGIERVRVEVLAERLGITKGGFYRRFKDRRALLDALLEEWKRGRIAVITKHTELDGGDPRERLKELIRHYSERANPEGMAIELAIRQWARSDAAAMAAVASVDAARMKAVAQLYARLGFAPDEAQARAVIFYSFIFGQGLLVLDQAARRRASLTAACAEVLTRVEPVSSP
jgi:AcrR family transcriptional regulator